MKFQTPIKEMSVLFWLGCIPVRLAFAYIGTQAAALPYVAVAASLISVGFATIYIFNLRPNAPEGGGGPTWWNNLRPIHAGLYLTTALFAFKGSTTAGSVLLADTLLGVGAALSRSIQP